MLCYLQFSDMGQWRKKAITCRQPSASFLRAAEDFWLSSSFATTCIDSLNEMRGAYNAQNNSSKATRDYAATESFLDVVHQCGRVCTPGQRLPVSCLSQRLEALVWTISLVRQLRPRQVSETRLHCLQLQSRPGSAQLPLTRFIISVRSKNWCTCI